MPKKGGMPLTEEQLAEIVRLYESGVHTGDLAAQFKNRIKFNSQVCSQLHSLATLARSVVHLNYKTQKDCLFNGLDRRFAVSEGSSGSIGITALTVSSIFGWTTRYTRCLLPLEDGNIPAN